MVAKVLVSPCSVGFILLWSFQNPEDELEAAALRLREQEQTCVRLQRALRTQQQQTQTMLQRKQLCFHPFLLPLLQKYILQQ